MTSTLFDSFIQAEDRDQLQHIGEQLASGGYITVYRFIEQFRDAIKKFSDHNVSDILQWLENGKIALPDPGAISPSWQHLWQQFDRIIQYKRQVLDQVPDSERDGEWQVLLDNPYTHQEIVCYPGLSFGEAAYLYGYFRSDLEKNEYIRIQKVQTVIMEFGS